MLSIRDVHILVIDSSAIHRQYRKMSLLIAFFFSTADFDTYSSEHAWLMSYTRGQKARSEVSPLH